MGAYVNLSDHIPDLEGLYIHALSAEEDDLAALLRSLAFNVYVLSGAEIRDKPTFFREAVKALELPEYCQPNWDDFDDCLSELRLRENRKLAIVWKDPEVLFANDTQVFVDAICTFHSFAESFRMLDDEHGGPLQLEVFIIGGGSNFEKLPWRSQGNEE